MEVLISQILSQIIFAILVVFPLWKIHEKAGKNPALSLFVFIPYLGLFIVALILAFSNWPATETTSD
jgi:hypothetical protein